jgi:hypothetical protein
MQVLRSDAGQQGDAATILDEAPKNRRPAPGGTTGKDRSPP